MDDSTNWFGLTSPKNPKKERYLKKKKKEFYYEKNSNFASTLFQSNKNKIGSSEKKSLI